MAVWALLSISQTVKAADCYIMGSFDKNGALSKLDGQSMTPLGNNQYSQEYKCTTSGKYYFRFALEGNDWQWCPYKNDYELTAAIPDYGCHKTNEEGHSGIFFFVNFESGKTYTFKCDANSAKVSCTVSAEGSSTVTPTEKYCSFYLIGNLNNDSEWADGTKNNRFTTNDGKTYTYTFTGVEKFVYFRVQGYGSDGNKFGKDLAPNATKDKALTTNFEDVKYELYKYAKAWKIDAKSDKTYTITLLYNGTESMPQIKYSDGSGTVTPPTPPASENPIANRKYSEGYYLVGNFFNFDGADINYDDAVFKFQQQKDDADGNAVYMVEIPATLTAKAQVMSVDATGTPNAVYGPTKGYATIDNTNPVVGEDHTAKLGPENLVESTKISENDGNFWNMKSRRTLTTEGGQDGSYTYYITIDKDTKKPSLWTIKYDDMKRVAYYLSTDEKATAMTLNSVRSDVNDEFNAGKYQGTLYAQKGSEFYAISNAMRHIEDNNNIFAEYRDHVVVMDNILSTYPKLFLWGNGGKPLAETGNFIAATNGTFKLSDDVVGISSWEFNSNNGNNDDNSKYGNTGGQVLQKTTHKTITSLSMVGTAIPGTTTGSEWDWTSTVADMDYDISENCYKLTIATTDDCTNKPFRFVGNHTQEINWFENGLEESDKAATYPYAENLVGHKASPSDPNEVSYTENGLRESTDDNVNIIWNRPAGTYTVRFYIYTYSQNGNDPSYRYFYTITENHSVALKDFENVLYNGNPRNILNRGSYRFFRTFSDTKAWKCPNGVHIYIVNKFIPAKEETSTSEVSTASYSLKEINPDTHIIPEKTGVILATADVTVGVYSEKTDPNFYNLLTINLTEVAEGASYEKPVEGESLLTPLYVGRNLQSEEGNYYNYLFGFYRAQRFDPTVDPSTFWLGFWISNGTGIYNSNGAYMKISKEQAKGMRLGTSYSFGPDGKAKCIPALLFDFANANETTGISMVKNTTVDDKYYTLSGVQVANPSTKGIYIHNGKKIVIK